MKLIVLDRDGVINEDVTGTITKPEQWQPIEGSLDAIARLSQAGWHVAVTSNQSGIARGLLDLDTLNAIHRKMHDAVLRAGGRIDVVAFCPHTDSDDCNCRKPAPGMLYSISERLGVDLADVIVVGDSLRDMQAAMVAAARPVLVRTGKGQRTLDNNKGLGRIPIHDDLASFVTELLAGDSEESKT
ncbi:MAG: D-glycero-beta-D-manno-heptose-1,7-bisphosphate 7-phosphatase [Gammaproteobacteria bacterium]|nr:MAG: D-glycero-beta-D-manno-heptose-1,7-bisphosphate 7-phosphatase [Gammaproteobacteria bacterium]PIE37789.1 MAG: D-glycero-beta-D-manno-heptose-1,7-bisphosphate 7-phosphatase [Gammaproteobacteria bacterium]